METNPKYKQAAEIRVLFMTLMKMSTRSLDQFFASRNADINGMQYGILRTLSHHQFTLSELSKLFVLDPSTLVPVVDTLERRGFVERGRDPNDRRRIPLHLTAAGTDMVKSAGDIVADDPLFTGLEKLGEEKTRHLLTLLRELVHHTPDGDQILDDLHQHLSLPDRCPQRRPGNDV